MSDGALIHVIVFAAWFFGGFVNGISGMGAALIAIPLVACVADMSLVVPSGCIIGTFIAIFVALMYWKQCDWRMALPMILGSFPGAFLGVFMLTITPGALIQGILGVLLVSFVGWQLVAHKWVRVYRASRLGAFLAGIAGGFGNGATTIGGPPVAIYATLVGWDKDKVRGTISCYFTLNSILAFLIQWGSGLYTPEVWSAACFGIPGACAGLVLSIPIARCIREEAFRKMLLAVISGGGLLLLFRSFS